MTATTGALRSSVVRVRSLSGGAQASVAERQRGISERSWMSNDAARESPAPKFV